MATGCENRLSIVHPAGPAAAAIADLWWIMLAGGLTILALVLTLLGMALYRPARTATPAATYLEGAEPGNTGPEAGLRVWIWGLGLGFPLVTLAALTGYGLTLGDRLLPHPASDLVSVSAEARQWVWTFRYAEAPGRVTKDVLHIPADRPVDVTITSTDVIHAFWVPRLAGKLDAIPGHVNVLRIEAAVAGTYAGQSAEFSGRGYREHVFAVQAHDAASWAAFLQAAPP